MFLCDLWIIEKKKNFSQFYIYKFQMLTNLRILSATYISQIICFSMFVIIDDDLGLEKIHEIHQKENYSHICQFLHTAS